jgi:hypothetical protein
MPATTKELVINCFDSGEQGVVEVSETDTLRHVRSLILEEFDEDLLPSPNGGFCFRVNGNIRISEKQEAKKLAWDYLSQDKQLSLHARATTGKRNLEETATKTAEQQQQPQRPEPAKRARISTSESDHHRLEETQNHAVAPADVNRVVPEQAVEQARHVSSRTGRGSTRRHASLAELHASLLAQCNPSHQLESNRGKQPPVERNNTHQPARAVRSRRQPKKIARKNAVTSQQSTFQPTAGHHNNSISQEPVVRTTGNPFGGNQLESDVFDAAAASDDESVLLQMDTVADLNEATYRDNKYNTAMVQTTMAGQEEINTEDDDKNPHSVYDEAVQKSCGVLRELQEILQEEQLQMFCTPSRRQAWLNKITNALEESTPKTIIGCLGLTGVGKSSLLNALLDEGSVLPTSGSRGCTAAAVELRYNDSLKRLQEASPEETCHVYKAEIEFMTIDEWGEELKHKLQEITNFDTNQIMDRVPDEQREPEAAAAWGSIDQVYGKGTVQAFMGQDAEQVGKRLMRDRRVRNLLTPLPNVPYNIVRVSEGEVNASDAGLLLGTTVGRFQGSPLLMTSKEQWAKAFRDKINDYVYRKGNGNEPQAWPLIRKVVIFGPWAVLSSGACLVDLPGVKDAVATRSKVAQSYLKNCSTVWIVAPIKRAVSDGTARDLMGEQFKRRLLMDGQYGNVSFICTQTDDCEPSEIMRDHEDVARGMGHWEKMKSLYDEIARIEPERSNRAKERQVFKKNAEKATAAYKSAHEEFHKVQSDGEGGANANLLAELEAALSDKKLASQAAKDALKDSVVKYKQMSASIARLQLQLKSLCAIVRNEYSSKTLQEDFKSGLKDLIHKDRQDDDDDDDDSGRDYGNEDEHLPLPENFQLAVHSISANDYLKLQGLKSSSDGAPSTFDDPERTQIPKLRSFVHETTLKHHLHYARSFCGRTSAVLDQMRLLATSNSDTAGSASGEFIRMLFENEMKTMENKLEPLVADFKSKAQDLVQSRLRPSLLTGAARGGAAMPATVVSWGSKSRRTPQECTPEKNGLHYRTYEATMRRDGVYDSPTAGPIDCNSDLLDPMERTYRSVHSYFMSHQSLATPSIFTNLDLFPFVYSIHWQHVMSASIKEGIADLERKIFALSANVALDVLSSFTRAELDAVRLQGMAAAANRAVTASLKTAFQGMRDAATNKQRDLNRCLLPRVATKMRPGYSAAIDVTRGRGFFDRMKSVMTHHVGGPASAMFDELCVELLKGIDNMLSELTSMARAMSKVIRQNLENVYSLLWDDEQESKQLNPLLQKLVQECRDTVLPDINRLRQIQNEALETLGIELEEPELDVLGVDSPETVLQNKQSEAVASGKFVDLAFHEPSDDGDDDDDDVVETMPVPEPVRSTSPGRFLPLTNPFAGWFSTQTRRVTPKKEERSIL